MLPFELLCFEKKKKTYERQTDRQTDVLEIILQHIFYDYPIPQSVVALDSTTHPFQIVKFVTLTDFLLKKLSIIFISLY